MGYFVQGEKTGHQTSIWSSSFYWTVFSLLRQSRSLHWDRESQFEDFSMIFKIDLPNAQNYPWHLFVILEPWSSSCFLVCGLWSWSSTLIFYRRPRKILGVAEEKLECLRRRSSRRRSRRSWRGLLSSQRISANPKDAGQIWGLQKHWCRRSDEVPKKC